MGHAEPGRFGNPVLRRLRDAHTINVVHSASRPGIGAATVPEVVAVSRVADLHEIDGEGIGPSAEDVGAGRRGEERARAVASMSGVLERSMTARAVNVGFFMIFIGSVILFWFFVGNCERRFVKIGGLHLPIVSRPVATLPPQAAPLL